ncbi:phospholipase [Natronorubrum sp. JWXQ-INN-674]|uniref:Phospholipase n=1 Tax=Natronorubrum halalkaliphilum TaxID=2691917 RepID=A0A6B0VQF2_9EURY|nr:phospholipase D-like domain-containing protein [Natronorubrum halalkaliphilum]MXV63704.1 phospholipase [Natronorubrum halalkaliphilum]
MPLRRIGLVALVVVTLVASGATLGFVAGERVLADASSTPASARGAADALDCPAGLQGRPGLTDEATASRIVELYPNPTVHDNVGEYLVLATPPETRLENWTITDGHRTAALPNETVSGRVALSTSPNVTKGLTDEPVLELEGSLRLAVDGDDLELRNGSTTVDAVSYERAPLAERWFRANGDRDGTQDGNGDNDAETNGNGADETTTTTPATGDWHPRGATCLPVSSSEVNEATAFVLPDAPEVPVETIRQADDRLLLAGYTFTSSEAASVLLEAADRGVDVAVILESGPVGGTPETTEPVLERLEDGGVDVRVTGGEGARYRYHHPKYAVADDLVLVTSENWKPSGIGGASSRGWGVRLEDEALAADLASVFRADHEGWDTQSGAAFRANTSFVDDDSAATPSRSFPAEHEPATLPVDSAELLVAPDNAEERLVELIAAAEDDLLIKQASIDGDVSVLEASVDAAHRGVDVTILLDSTWYHEDENDALADDLERLAADESLPLEVALVDETDRFEKIHAKGVVIDRETAVVGSANWNENAFTNNREVLLALHGEEIAAYYAAVFEDDWEGDGGPWTLPYGLSVTVVVALALAALVGRRYVHFGDPQ